MVFRLFIVFYNGLVYTITVHEKIKKSVTNPLISGSFVVTIGTTIGNIFNYLFHLAMGRSLTPADYGTLTAIISFISIFGVVSMTITTVVAI